jgi:predicted DNA binding CopG/RHH family protein
MCDKVRKTTHEETMQYETKGSFISIRLPSELKERLKKDAVENGRTLNGQVCHVLRKALGMGNGIKKQRGV